MKIPTKQDLIKISEFIWEIPKSFRNDMKVPARIFADEKMLNDILKDKSLWQLVNLTTLPGVYKYALATPDVHEGFGSPIGGVFATDINNEGIISPGACGYDINCGVRLLTSDLNYDEIKNNVNKLLNTLYNEVPSGVGSSGFLKLNNDELKKILEDGSKYIIEKWHGTNDDLIATESEGKIDGADFDFVSKKARERGKDQSGTLGAGNHFIEIQKITEIFNEEFAEEFGLWRNQITISIHCGSRGLGHQIAGDYIKDFLSKLHKYKIELQDKELSCAPFNSDDGRAYFSAMACAANFAFANRQVITHQIRKVFKKIFGEQNELKQVYDIAHNIVKIEKYEGRELSVHRKGATRAFEGQPVLIPGSMGTASYVLVGKKLSAELTFSSAPHGAGRALSRSEARKNLQGANVKKQLQEKGIAVMTGSISGLAEESPDAYKDVDRIIEIVHNLGIAKKVAKMVPLGVIKG